MSDTTPRGNGTEIVPRTEPQSLLNVIARAMDDDRFDVLKLDALLRMQRELVAEQARHEFSRAMSAAQGEMRAVFRNAANEQTHSRYARLEKIDDAIRPIYTTHGFSLTFGTEKPADPASIRVVCDCAHSGGHTKVYELEAPPDMTGTRGQVNKTLLHGMGSTISYLRRYLTTMIFNVVLTNEDDDGNAGGGTIRNPADGMGENIERRPPPPPRPTARQLLEEIERDAANALTGDDIASLRTSDNWRTIERYAAGHPARIRLAEILAATTARVDAAQKGAPADAMDDAVPPDTTHEAPPDDVDARVDKIIAAIRSSSSPDATLRYKPVVDLIVQLTDTGMVDQIQRIEAARQARLAELGPA
jgi:hypothetical protein